MTTINGYRLQRREDADEETRRAIIRRYRQFNYSIVPEYYDVEKVANDLRSVDFVLYDEAGNIIGGLLADIYWRSLYVEFLWIEEALRKGGIGTQLMTLAEDEARRQDCDFMWLTTYSFQARPFYEKLGFYIIGRLDGHPPGYTVYTMRKDLK
jgi:GNAT superfamily N-acetyltransferase